MIENAENVDVFLSQVYLSAVSSPCLALWDSGGLQGFEMHTWLLSGRRTDSKQRETKTKHKTVGCCRGVFVLSFRRTEDRSRCQTWLWGTAESRRRRRRSRGMWGWWWGICCPWLSAVCLQDSMSELDSAFLFQKGFWCSFFLSENRRGRRKYSEAGSSNWHRWGGVLPVERGGWAHLWLWLRSLPRGLSSRSDVSVQSFDSCRLMQRARVLDCFISAFVIFFLSFFCSFVCLSYQWVEGSRYTPEPLV